MGLDPAALKNINNFYKNNPNYSGIFDGQGNPVLPIQSKIPSMADFNFQQPQVSLPTQNFGFTPPAALDFNALLQGAQSAQSIAAQPLAPQAQALIAPQLPILKQNVEGFLGQQKANAQSDFLKRGITGGSTETQTLIRDLPTQAAGILAQGEADLFSKALPLAQAQQQAQVQAAQAESQFGLSLRSLVSEESFKTLNLEQRENLTRADLQMKSELSRVDQNFQAQLLIAQQNFESAQNELDRQIAQEQLNQLHEQRREASRDAIIGSIIVAGGSILGGPLGAGIALGGVAASSKKNK